MAPKINRTLIPFLLLVMVGSLGQGISTGMAPSQTALFPLIAQDSSRWIGPYGGTLVSIAIDPVHPQVVYAGSFGSGVYKSTDGGSTWFPASHGLTNLYVYSLALDPSNPAIVYAGTYRSQVYKSADGGVSWAWSGSGMQESAIVYNLAVDPIDPRIVYASTRGLSNNGSPPWNGVVYKSTDWGSTWSISLKNLGGAGLQDWAYSITVNPYSHNQVLIAAHETGPHRSDNYGASWYPIDNGVTDYSGRAVVISPDPAHKSTYYYGVWHEDSVYKSNDNATSWWPVNQGFTYQHVYSIALDPQNINNVYLATFVNGILKSTDGGGSWKSSGLAADIVYSVVIDPDTPSHLLAGTGGDGVFKTINSGASWSHSNQGIENAMVTSVVISQIVTPHIYAGLYGGGVYTSEDQGKSWEQINHGLNDLIVLDLVKDPAHPGILFGLTESGLYKNDLNTSNGWTLVGQGLPLSSQLLPAYPPDHPFTTLDLQEAFANPAVISTNNPSTTVPLITMVYAPSNPSIAYLGTAGAGVYRSTNGGQNWTPAGLGGESINSLAVDQANANLVYAATTQPGSLKVSANGGQSWSSVNLPVTFYSLIASPTTPGVVFTGTNNGVYRYQSAGWTSLGLEGLTVTSIQVDPGHPNKLYCGTDTSAYYTLNGGKSWITANGMLDEQTIQDITIDPAFPDQVYFSTKTHGIFLLVSQN
jgi:photosystem II stability/assembly factor-like uncharacterized protein